MSNSFSAKTSCFLSSLLCLTLFLTPINTYGELPEAPRILDAAVGGCQPTQEICGDGIDQDCNGSDAICPGSDGDFDGFSSGQDCDDSNRNIYPGISVSCTADCGQGTKTCQSSGAFTSCSCTPLCEATGNGRCFYVSKLTGSDSNPGSFQQPWKTYMNFVPYYSGTPKPAKWTALQAGDVVYFMSGVYSEIVNYGGSLYGLYLLNLNGTSSNKITLKAYPGANPIFAPAQQVYSIYVSASNHIVLEGFEVTKGWNSGIRLGSGSFYEVRNMWVHDIHGSQGDNIAGIYMIDSNNVNIHHNTVNDNYDRAQKTNNNRNIVLFKGANVRVHRNVLFHSVPISAPSTGGCVTYKHASDIAGSIFEVDHNIMKNCYYASVGSSTWGTRIHHNLIIDSDPIFLGGHGGTTHTSDMIVEFNTIIRGSGLIYNPKDTYSPIGLVTYRKNVIFDQGTYNPERGILTIGTYLSDSLYNATVSSGKLAINQNCYYNPNRAGSWSLFAANGGEYGSLGGQHSFSSWKGLGFDNSGFEVNPNLDSNFIPQNASCSNFGWSAP